MKVKISKYPKNGSDRKYKVKINDHDVYSADVTLAIVILPLLRKIRKQKNGSPSVDNSDVPEELWKPDDTAEHDTDDNWFPRWEYVLDEMIWAFKQLHPTGDNWADQFYTGTADFDFVKSDETDNRGDQLYMLTYGPDHTLVFDNEGHRKYSDRIDNGLRLFGRYFRALWT